MKRKLIVEDPDTGELAVDRDAFKPRVEDGVLESDLSGNHTEYFGGIYLEEDLRRLKIHLIQSVGLNLKPNGAFAVAAAGAIIRAGLSGSVSLDVLSDPLPSDLSHAVIVGVPVSESLLQLAIAQEMEVVELKSL